MPRHWTNAYRVDRANVAVERLLSDPVQVPMGCDPGDPDSSATELIEEEYVELFDDDPLLR
jgi:hypothetical protein